MKTQFIKLTENSGIVDLPEGATNPEVQYVGSGVFLWWEDGSEYGSFTRLPWDAEIHSLAEETAARMVDDNINLLEIFVKGRTICQFRDYSFSSKTFRTMTALESLTSLIESKGYFLKNPHGEKPEMSDFDSDLLWHGIKPDEFDEKLQKWQSAEEKTIQEPCFIN